MLYNVKGHCNACFVDLIAPHAIETCILIFQITCMSSLNRHRRVIEHGMSIGIVTCALVSPVLPVLLQRAEKFPPPQLRK